MNTIQHIKHLAYSDLKECLRKLQRFAEEYNDKTFMRQVDQAYGRYTELKKQQIHGTISYENANLEMNRIRQSALELIEQVVIPKENYLAERIRINISRMDTRSQTLTYVVKELIEIQMNMQFGYSDILKRGIHALVQDCKEFQKKLIDDPFYDKPENDEFSQLKQRHNRLMNGYRKETEIIQMEQKKLIQEYLKTLEKELTADNAVKVGMLIAATYGNNSFLETAKSLKDIPSQPLLIQLARRMAAYVNER